MIQIESNETDSAFLKRRKSSVLKKYSPTRSNTIEEANELAVYMHAVDQTSATESLLESYCNNSPFVEHKPERWEAVCFAKLFKAHLNQPEDSAKQTLIDELSNDELFSPTCLFAKEGGYKEFIESSRNEVNNVKVNCGLSQREEGQILAEGYLVLLVAYYIWSEKWPDYAEHKDVILEESTNKLKAIKDLIT